MLQQKIAIVGTSSLTENEERDARQYISYIIKINYIEVEEIYSKLYNYIKLNNCTISNKVNYTNYNLDQLYTDKIYPQGYFELSEIKWYLLEELLTKARNKDKSLHYRLRNILYQLPK